MMEKKTVGFKATIRQIFYTYVSIMNSFLKLSKRESQVLAELLFYNYQYKTYSESAKWKLVFHKDTKVQIQEDLGISVHQFNNILTSLRKKNLIVNNTIKKSLLIYPDQGLHLEFNIRNEKKG